MWRQTARRRDANTDNNRKTNLEMTKLKPAALESHYYDGLVEAGCDEAGRGCLAGSVYAAAVILPPDYRNDALNDSKQLSAKSRNRLREEIERDAVAWAVGIVTPEEIDRINILNASILAMHRALDALKVRPEAVIVDGNRFKPYAGLPYSTIVKGDGKYLAIAAASILAKTYRDDYMDKLAEQYPQYDWQSNKGYPTKKHRNAIKTFGITPFHRRTFNLLGNTQLPLWPDDGQCAQRRRGAKARGRPRRRGTEMSRPGCKRNRLAASLLAKRAVWQCKTGRFRVQNGPYRQAKRHIWQNRIANWRLINIKSIAPGCFYMYICIMVPHVAQWPCGIHRET